MKTVLAWDGNDKKTPKAILAYDNSLSNGDLMETVYALLEIVAEAGGYRLTADFYELMEELPKRMTDEQKCLAGICCDCGGPVEPLTAEEIVAIKDDLGMLPEDDFAHCCADCELKYLPS